MRRLKVFVSVCLLATTLPTSAFASYKLDQDNQGVDIVDVAKALQDSQAMQTITGKSTYEKSDVQQLLRQVAPLRFQPVLGKVTGFVTDENGKAISSASITLDGLTTILTNVNGQFEFNNVPVAYQTSVHIHKDGYTDVNSDLFNILTGSTRDLGTMILRKIPTYGSVSGYVYGPDQVGLTAATVSVEGLTPALSVLTDSTGFFTLSNVPTGDRVLTVTKDTYVGSYQSFSVTANNVTTLQPIHLEKVTVPPVLSSITGLIKSDDNQPLIDARVSVTGTTYAAMTDANGLFTISNMPVGVTDLDITKQGYTPIHLSGITVTESVYDIGTIQLATVVSPKGSISGLVALSHGGGPVSLHIQGTDITVQAAATGNFAIQNLPVGNYTLQITADNYMEQNIPVTVTPNGNASVNVSLQRILVNVDGIAMTAAGPVPQGTRVTLQDTNYEARTDVDGKFTFLDLPAGSTIQAIAIENYQLLGTFTSFTVTANVVNSIGEVHFRLTPPVTSSITGLIKSDNNHPLIDARVSVTGTTFGAMTDANGLFTISNVPVGVTDLDITIQGYKPIHLLGLTVSESVYDIGTINLSAVAVSQEIIKGTLTDENGDPIAEASVNFNGVSRFTDSYGNFSFDGNSNESLNNGFLTIMKDGFETYPLFGINLSAGETLDLHMITMSVAKRSLPGKVELAYGDSPASIHVKGTNITVSTDAAGYFTIEALPVGDSTLEVTATNYEGLSVPVKVLQNGNTPVNISLVRKLANVEGKVVSTTGETIPPGTQVTIPGTSYMAYTDADGTFTFSNLPAGYTIPSISIANYLPKIASLAFTVTAGGTNNLGPIDLQPTGTMGIVNGYVELDGAHVANTTVILLDSNDNYVASTTTDALGWFNFGNFPVNGTFTLTIQKPGYAIAPRHLTVQPGYNDVDLHLKAIVSVHNESEFLAAYADVDVPHILLVNDIHLTTSLDFNREVYLSGMGGAAMTQLTAPSITISLYDPNKHVSWSELDMYSDVGNSRSDLERTLNRGFLEKINVNGLADYVGFIHRTGSYYSTTDENNRIAFVNSEYAFHAAQEDANVSRIYIVPTLTLYSGTSFQGGSIYVKDSGETIDPIPPTLTNVSTGYLELDLQEVQARVDEAATLYLVKEGTPKELLEILANQVASKSVSSSGTVSLNLSTVSQGNYLLYAVDTSGNVSIPSETIELHKSLSGALSDIRSTLALETPDPFAITYENLVDAGLNDVNASQIDLYRYTLNMNKVALLSANTNEDFVGVMQNGVETANAAPEINRILVSGIEGYYDWSLLEERGEYYLTLYGLDGIHSSSQLTVAEHLMELAFERGDRKLLTKAAMQTAIHDTVPSPQLSHWRGDPVKQELGSKRVIVSFNLQNSNEVSLKDYEANDFTIKVNGEETNLSNTDKFPFFLYNDEIDSYQFVFEGSADAASYTLSEFSLHGTNLELGDLSITTPDPYAILITSIDLSLIGNATRIATNDGIALQLTIGPSEATNKDIVWSVVPSGSVNATVDGQGHLNVTGLGHFTVTATNPMSGVSKSLELEAVDWQAALLAVKEYATNAVTTELTLKELENAYLASIDESAFNTYKEIIRAKGSEFVGLDIAGISSLLRDIIYEYKDTTAINQALFDYLGENPTTWYELDKESFAYAGATNVDDINITYLKQVILSRFLQEHQPFTKAQLASLVSNELEAAGWYAALQAVQDYATSEGTTDLTLEQFEYACLSSIDESAFTTYKWAIQANRMTFTEASLKQVSEQLYNIMIEYKDTATLNQALNNPAAWDELNVASLSDAGAFYVDETNITYVKQVILETFEQERKPLSRTQLMNLSSNVPSFRMMNPDLRSYATQMVSQHVNNETGNVVVTFRVGNAGGEDIASLTSQDVTAVISGVPQDLRDAYPIKNFQHLGGGEYSFEVLESALTSPLVIDSLNVKVGYTDIPIATNVSVNRQAALIEQKISLHTLNTEDIPLFAAGHLPNISELNYSDLVAKLELAYTAHGNVLAEDTIARIINGMRILSVYYVTTTESVDTYYVEFDQDITGSSSKSMSARNALGYLIRLGTSANGNSFDFSFGKSSKLPVVLTYTATTEGTLKYTEMEEAVPDFEIIFTEYASTE
ncbi:carboxypeptidase regulatory-like domain-containing protein [Paenibacillus roseipurpureus]|uniref:Carboxypeptidase regulatory-like domain-containing protein n=1 Tax=Paenibacillus roseopurpureus TaxID=2918901 RepID=A0AA96RMK1_9BACL|nr:carboxypeptidase regulatory-like domain-containing protein [Paenibacillus sp. MBLB1832]WNR44347.1 carboxypeptidase regulatory-like domain-containing protein [Paenibacillus sp. MBLB1832]